MKGINHGDLYLKQWHEQKVATEANGWRVIAKPGIVAVNHKDDERLAVCLLYPESFTKERARVKSLRFCNLLKNNLRQSASAWKNFISAPQKTYEANKFEQLPPYRKW